MCICYAVRPHAVLCYGKASFDGSAAASAIFPTASELAEEDVRPAPAASAALVPTLSTPLALSARRSSFALPGGAACEGGSGQAIVRGGPAGAHEAPEGGAAGGELEHVGLDRDELGALQPLRRAQVL